MRSLFLLPLPIMLMALAACGGSKEDAANQAQANQAAAMQRIPAPRTPVLNAPVAPGNQADWIAPQPGTDDPKTAPYGNVLSEPVVNAPSQPN